MKRRLVASLVVGLATFGIPAASAAAQQAEPGLIAEQLDTTAARPVTTSVDLSARAHDDWAFAPETFSRPVDLSPRTRDDWALPERPSASFDLSPASHDDWAVR